MHIAQVDRNFYQTYLEDFLPRRIFDVHAHIWLQSFELRQFQIERGAQWAGRVAAENTLDTLIAEYRQMLPRQQVTPLVFGWPSRGVDVGANNQWAAEQARMHTFPALLVSTPETPAYQLEESVRSGGFRGLKPYLEFAPDHLTPDQITIYDFLPHSHLEAANAHGWIVMLHIPRSKRISDPLNLTQIVEIEQKYPHLRLIIAHLGRAYCLEDLGTSMAVIQATERVLFDFSANTNAEVLAALIRTVGSQRLLFGSDMPITHMRMRRICENGKYINLVPSGLYGDVSDDEHMREVSQEEGEGISFFLYEQLLAFRRAAESTHLTQPEIESVFFHNANNLLALWNGEQP